MGSGTSVGANAAHAAGPPRVTLQLLGGFAVTASGRAWEVPDSARRLLVYLALRGRPQCRTHVAASLWPEKLDSRACANLRAALWRLPAPEGIDLVDSIGPNLHLSRHLDVDVRAVEAAGWSLIEDGPAAAESVDADHFLAELLPGWYEDWIIFERERIAQLHLRFLEALKPRTGHSTNGSWWDPHRKSAVHAAAGIDAVTARAGWTWRGWPDQDRK